MALKFMITKREELDQLAEPVRQLYTEKDGKWTLGVEGVVPESDHNEIKSKLVEFRDNNRTMFGELEKLRPLSERFKDIDPDEYKRLKAKEKELADKGIKTPDDIKAAIDAALKPVTERLEATEKERIAAQRAADDAKFRELISTSATGAGVKSKSLRHVIREAGEVFEFKDGKLVPKPGQKHPDDPLKDLTPEAWLLNLAKTDEYLFNDSTGGGAENNGNRGVGRPGARILVNPSPEDLGRHEAEIIKGEVVVQRT